MIWIAFEMKSDPCEEMDFINENPVHYTLYFVLVTRRTETVSYLTEIRQND